MTAWGVTAGCVLVAVSATACGSDGATAPTTTATQRTTSSSTAPERPTSTTTTTYAPDTVEGQVEAAYLRSWDVYADAVYNLKLDEAALSEVFADPLLSVLRDELKSRLEDGRAAHVRVEHGYTVQLTGEDTAAIIDRYLNHQVLIDPRTKHPVEADPHATITDAFTLRLDRGRWVVFDQRRIK